MVHGCFWHGHEGCRYFRLPRSNEEFWNDKIQKNRHRDKSQIEKLLDLDWRVSVVWECATRNRPTEDLIDEIARWLSGTDKRNEIAEDTGEPDEVELRTT